MTWIPRPLLLCLLALASMAYAQAPSREFMPLEEIRPGMKGYGLTVFKGFGIERFDAEVIDIMPNLAGPRSNIILMKLGGDANGILDKAHVIQGMSGSPVFLDDGSGTHRMAGAVSLGWSYSVETVAGVTPIAEMLDLMDRSEREPVTSAYRSLLFTPKDMESAASFMAALSGEGRGEAEGLSGFERTRAPIALSGLSPGSVRQFTPFLRRCGLEPVLSGATGYAFQPGETPSAYEPGSSIGVVMWSGDSQGMATGTVTYVRGDQLVAFGHPLYNSGQFSCPIGLAYVTNIVATQTMSYKRAALLGEPLGSLTQDRLVGIAGKIGAPARTVPVRVSFTPEFGGGKFDTPFRFNVIEDQDFLAGLSTILVNDVLTTGLADSPDVTIQGEMVAKIAGQNDVVVRRRFSGSTPFRAASSLVYPLAQVLVNRFEPVRVESIDVTISGVEVRQEGTLQSLLLLNGRIRSGDRLEMQARYRDYRGASFERTVTLALPEDLPAGKYSVVLGDDNFFRDHERKRAPGKDNPKSVADVIRSANEPESESQLHLMLKSPEAGIVLAGQEHPSLPPSVRALLRDERGAVASSPTKETLLVDQILDFPHPISGSAGIQIEVEP